MYSAKTQKWKKIQAGFFFIKKDDDGYGGGGSRRAGVTAYDINGNEDDDGDGGYDIQTIM